MASNSSTKAEFKSSEAVEVIRGIPLFSTFGIEMIDIKVGEDPGQKSFWVHKNLICARVPYFEKMFNWGGVETNSNAATFPEDSPEAFEILLGWVYTGRLRRFEILNDRKNPAAGEFSWDIVTFYALVEKLCLSELQDQALDCLANVLSTLCSIVSSKTIETIYTLTQQGCGLQKFAASTIVWQFLVHWKSNPENLGHLEEMFRKYPDLSADFILILTKSQGIAKDPAEEPRCKFHQHGAAAICYASRVKR